MKGQQKKEHERQEAEAEPDTTSDKEKLCSAIFVRHSSSGQEFTIRTSEAMHPMKARPMTAHDFSIYKACAIIAGAYITAFA